MPIDERDLYEEIGRNYRYFLDWRAKLLAGYFAVIVGLAVGFAWILGRSMIRLSSLAPFSLFGISVLFWCLDLRNRQQYHACIEAAAQLEEDRDPFSENPRGGYVRFRQGSQPSHSRAFDFMFYTLGLAALVAAIVLLGWPEHVKQLTAR